jgi:peptide/nickel transport system substrate-binding protein
MGRRTFLEAAVAFAGAAASRTGFSAERSVLRVRNYQDLASLDPAYSLGAFDEIVTATIYSHLIAIRPGSWEWQLEAASSIEQLDPRHIRFELRPGIEFTNGFGEMTADDVKFSFERIVDPKTEAPERENWGPLDRVEVKDRYSGLIVLREPFAPLWQVALPHTSGAIISRKATESVGGRYTNDPPCCSGPYELKEWVPKQRTVLVRNERFWGDRAPFDEIRILPIEDERVAEIAFEAGDLDFTGVSLGSVAPFKRAMPTNATLEEYPSLRYAWVGMNLEHENLRDVRVRRAIQLAIDVPSIIEAAFFGVATPSSGIVPPGLIGHREKSLIPPEANVDEALRLLADAGEIERTLTLDVKNTSAFATAAQVVQANLARVGLDIQLNLRETGDFTSLGHEKSSDRFKEIQLLINDYSMYPDPYYATAWFTEEQIGIWNWERFRDQEFNELHQKAIAEPDISERARMYWRMQELMELSGAYRFLTHGATPVIYRNTIVPALRPDGFALLRHFKRA